MEIDRLEKEVATLQLEKKKENTTHTSELENLKQQYEEQTKDLQYTIMLQAKHCQKQDSDLDKHRSSYAEKEQEVANLSFSLYVCKRTMNN